MTRLLCTGDWHVGAGSDYGRQPGDRLIDQERVLDAIVDLAIDHDVDAMLIAGDLWHRRRPTPSELLAVARPLRRLHAETDIEVIAIPGNHCIESADSPTALDLFEDIVDIRRTPGVWPGPQGVSVACLPWTPVARLVASQNGGDRDRLNETAGDILIRAARDLREKITGPAVLLLHWSVTGAALPTGMPTDELREVVLELGALEGLGFDAIVMGHIHRAQIPNHPPLYPDSFTSQISILDGPGPIFYTGSPAPVDFGEGDTQHGVWLLELGPTTELQFLPIESRPFVTVDCDLTSGDHPAGIDETDVVAAAIAVHLPLDDAVIRIRYRATEEQARRIDWPKLQPLLARVHKVYSVQGQIEREARARVEGVDEDLAPLHALDMWVGSQALEDWQGESLRALTGAYLEAVT